MLSGCGIFFLFISTTDSKDQISVDGTEGSSNEKQDSQDEPQVHPERFKKSIRLSSDELVGHSFVDFISLYLFAIGVSVQMIKQGSFYLETWASFQMGKLSKKHCESWEILLEL